MRILVSNAVREGVSFLESMVLSSGAWPNQKLGDSIGVWTTAEVLGAISQACEIRTPVIDAGIEFVLSRQLSDGSWPSLNEYHGNIPATSASLCALSMFVNFPNAGCGTIKKASEEGIEVISSSQNPDGGWSTMVRNDAQIDSRIMTTCYALAALFAYKSARLRNCIEMGIAFLLEAQNNDGGWGTSMGDESNLSDTCKTITLLANRASPRVIGAINDALQFANQVFEAGQPCTVYKENFGPNTQEFTVFRNTPFEVALATLASPYGAIQSEAMVKWYVDSQNEDGSWFLRNYPRGNVIPTTTWSTAEAIFFLKRYLQKNEI